MSEDYPKICLNGGTKTIQNDSDVKDAFTTVSGFKEGTQIEEWVVEDIDGELDYHKTEGYVLNVYVYFSALENVRSGWIPDENLDVDGWNRETNTLGNKEFGINYVKIP